MPGYPSNVDNSRTRVYCAFNKYGLVLLELFVCRLLYPFSFPSFVGDGEKTEIMSKNC